MNLNIGYSFSNPFNSFLYYAFYFNKQNKSNIPIVTVKDNEGGILYTIEGEHYSGSKLVNIIKAFLFKDKWGLAERFNNCYFCDSDSNPIYELSIDGPSKYSSSSELNQTYTLTNSEKIVATIGRHTALDTNYYIDIEKDKKYNIELGSFWRDGFKLLARDNSCIVEVMEANKQTRDWKVNINCSENIPLLASLSVLYYSAAYYI